VIKKE